MPGEHNAAWLAAGRRAWPGATTETCPPWRAGTSYFLTGLPSASITVTSPRFSARTAASVCEITHHHPGQRLRLDLGGGLLHLRRGHRLDLGLATQHVVVRALELHDRADGRGYRAGGLVGTGQAQGLDIADAVDLGSGGRLAAIGERGDFLAHFRQCRAGLVDLHRRAGHPRALAHRIDRAAARRTTSACLHAGSCSGAR